MTSREVIDRHRNAGRMFEADGLRSFVLEQGEGPPVVCLHGVPASSFLYRKVIVELAGRGLRGIAFDLPGLGLADRPEDYDYSWSGLGRFAVAAVQALGLDRFHLVVHDIGGPVGFELAGALRERVQSLLVLNTIIEVHTFRRPWSMEPFAIPGVGELWVASMVKPLFRQLMWLQGIKDRKATPVEEIDSYVDLLKRVDGGRAFLKIMRGFERTPEKSHLYVSTIRDVPYPVDILWGADDPVLTLDRHGTEARRLAGLERLHSVPAKHFLQEDQAPAVADQVAALVART